MYIFLRTSAFAFVLTALLATSAGAAPNKPGSSPIKVIPGAMRGPGGGSEQPDTPPSHCTPGPDRDGDCVADEDDNCPWGANADQADSDFDYVGNVCDGDYDQDGDADDDDNCWDEPNADQADLDGDGVGNLCDIDRDGDGYTNEHEATVGTSPDNWDTDGDHVKDSVDCAKTDPTKAIGEDCEVTQIGNTPPDPIAPSLDDPFADDDGDGTRNGTDNCPDVFNPGQQDIDGDGFGDACDNAFGSVQAFFVKGGGGPGANCTLFTAPATGSSLPLTALLMIPALLMGIVRKRS